jgi:hypothetical protein
MTFARSKALPTFLLLVFTRTTVTHAAFVLNSSAHIRVCGIQPLWVLGRLRGWQVWHRKTCPVISAVYLEKNVLKAVCCDNYIRSSRAIKQPLLLDLS